MAINNSFTRKIYPRGMPDITTTYNRGKRLMHDLQALAQSCKLPEPQRLAQTIRVSCHPPGATLIGATGQDSERIAVAP